MSSWENFWRQQNDSFYEIMKLSTSFFALQLEKSFDLKLRQKVFDYGCGPGFLLDHLSTKQVEVTGADINKLFLEQIRKKHPAHKFFQISTEPLHNKTILEKHLTEEKFDLIVLLSVVQYFDNHSTLERTIHNLCPFLKDEGTIIIADVVDPETSSIKDAISLLLYCLKKGKSVAFFKFILYLIFSDYRKLSKNVQLLQVSNETMIQIAKSNSMSCKRIDGLTLHPTRASYTFIKSLDTNFH
jgi:2-polyprenyl-3-methyl-5-hydroxy-6-metoxy-1,4-benzoquinol methylase